MDILKWWAQHPEIVAIGQSNIDKHINILAREPFEMKPLPESWDGFQISLHIEDKKISPNKKEDDDTHYSPLFEEMSF